MSVNNLLNTMVRPTVRFDAGSAEHRHWAHQFITKRTWAGCPWVFALPQSEDNVYNMVLRLLALYYTEQEFGSVAKKPHKDTVVHISVDKRQVS